MRRLAILALPLVLAACGPRPIAESTPAKEPEPVAAAAKGDLAQGGDTPVSSNPVSPGNAGDALPKTSGEPSTKPGNSTSQPTTAPVPPAGGPAEATFNASQLRSFMKDFGTLGGHGGWTPDQVENTVKLMLAIPKGSREGGPIHIDYQGRHHDVQMEVERLDADKYKLTFRTDDAGVREMVAGKLAQAGG